ncbi:hypothetical protein BSL78_03057 [Apostichopus japonicus]|uniref:Integrase catalytic domain-containing protein n=1 Tax=Stichopus japonicus TaxID=307972 RepID=A0A2G8LII3_STIJA|nr:hypothetical protein BSL78_03057 [Apostichopus japonicus]
MRKWRPRDVSSNDEWRTIHQIVVPPVYRKGILSVAHDTPFAGHLGVTKTYNRILENFFWPGLRSAVADYCKSCHACQIVGKPNQTIPKAPLKPIPAFEEPFSRVIVDCVGPLPKTRSGHEYLLTIMCASTRFPEAIPLRNIKAKTISTALLKFFTTFGLPKSVQSDQGSNFMSNLFQQVLYELNIHQIASSAYHPESQGALERFHQTLKSMIKTYCFDKEKQWDQGIPPKEDSVSPLTPLPSPEVKSISTPTGVALATAPCIRDQSDGSFRFCTDYRKVNSVTRSDSYPIPRIDDCIDQIGQSKYVTKFDLLKGYWEIPLSEAAKRISAFVTPCGLYQYTVMPFGMKNAPATFQRFINTLVGDLQGCSVYIDDIVIYSQTWQEHIAQIRSLMERLCSANLTVNLVKNFEKQFKLAVDASDFGAGSILLQQDSEGIDHPVCYFSKKFNKHQQNYSTVEKETLALLLSLQMFDVYLGTTLFL